MPALTHREKIDWLAERMLGDKRELDVALAMRREKTGETLLYAGGVWDVVGRHWVDRDPGLCCLVDVKESQVEFVRWFANWLEDFRLGYPRDISLAFTEGGRRGGKSTAAILCTFAAVIAVPYAPDKTPTRGWVVARTYRHRDQLEARIRASVSPSLFHYRDKPHYLYDFVNGGSVQFLSADRPEAIKLGRADVVFIDEPQLMKASAVQHALFGTADKAGLTIFAANPPEKNPRAEWMHDLRDGIRDDPEAGAAAEMFRFDPKQNNAVDSAARKRAAKLASLISPDDWQADAEGVWERWGDRAYPAFDKRVVGWYCVECRAPGDGPGECSCGETIALCGHVGPAPDTWRDVTEQLTRELFGHARSFVIGGDFQYSPQAAAVLRVLDGPSGRVYCFEDEVLVQGQEDDMGASLIARGYGPQRALWIADCSGSYQGAARLPGRTSFNLLEALGYRVYPGEVIKIPEKSDHPKNPDVDMRLKLMRQVHEQLRFRVHPRCEALIRALTKCQLQRRETGTVRPKWPHSHITDACAYPVWRLEKRPKRAHDGPPAPGMIGGPSR